MIMHSITQSSVTLGLGQTISISLSLSLVVYNRSLSQSVSACRLMGIQLFVVSTLSLSWEGVQSGNRPVDSSFLVPIVVCAFSPVVLLVHR